MLLTNTSILITRPIAQAMTLSQQLQLLGAESFIFPSLVIEPLPIAIAAMQLTGLAASDFDYVIVTSQHAVMHAPPIFAALGWHWPVQWQWFAVGQATAAAMVTQGWGVPICPQIDYTSEGLLALPQLTQVAGQRILILSGEGGRDVLQSTLQARGANVQQLAVYRRVCPSGVSVAPLLQCWATQGIDIVVSHSGESLTHLLTLLGETGRTYWQNTPLLVVSSRMAALAKDYHHASQIIVACNASDTAVIAALLQWKRESLDE